MFSERALAGQTVDIVLHAVDSTGVAITGASDFVYSMYRQSDGAQFDFGDNTFGAPIGTATQALTEIGSTAVYSHRIDLSAITNHATAKDTFIIVFAETGTDLLTIPRGEIVVNPQDMVAAAYQGAIWIDNAGGTSGSQLGIHGTMLKPCTTIAEADTLSTATGIKTYNIIDGPLTLNAATYANYTFNGVGENYQSITLNSKNLNNSSFNGLTITGTAGTGAWQAKRCYVISANIGAAYVFRECEFSGTITLNGSAGNTVFLDNCSALRDEAGAGLPTFTVNDLNNSMRCNNWCGNVTITGVTHASARVSLLCTAGQVTLAAGCTAGQIEVGGIGTIADSSAGSTVTVSGLLSPEIVKALMLGNAVVDNQVYDANGFMTSARLRLFNSSANTPSSGGGSETTGLLGTVTITGTANSSFPTLPGFVRGVLTE